MNTAQQQQDAHFVQTRVQRAHATADAYGDAELPHALRNIINASGRPLRRLPSRRDAWDVVSAWNPEIAQWLRGLVVESSEWTRLQLDVRRVRGEAAAEARLMAGVIGADHPDVKRCVYVALGPEAYAECETEWSRRAIASDVTGALNRVDLSAPLSFDDGDDGGGKAVGILLDNDELPPNSHC